LPLWRMVPTLATADNVQGDPPGRSSQAALQRRTHGGQDNERDAWGQRRVQMPRRRRNPLTVAVSARAPRQHLSKWCASAVLCRHTQRMATVSQTRDRVATCCERDYHMVTSRPMQHTTGMAGHICEERGREGPCGSAERSMGTLLRTAFSEKPGTGR
jgi:hypothetical protein